MGTATHTHNPSNGRWRQEDCSKLKASLGYCVRTCQREREKGERERERECANLFNIWDK